MKKGERGQPELLLVHCVDTEGPLDETLEATFARLEDIYGIAVEPTVSNLRKIQQKKASFIPRDLTELAAKTFSQENLSYLRTWGEVDEMLQSYFSNEFRSRLVDDFGGQIATSWFVMDHEDYKPNPRNKAIGQGVVHEKYADFLLRHPSVRDEIQYHFHPSSISGNPVGAGTSFANSLPRLTSDLAMRLITFQWFPSTFRPGFHSVRPDSHLWLEQWFPFDFSNQAYETSENQPDLSHGRFGDWRRAPRTWRGYRPSLADHQLPGSLDRTVFRCLNVGTRLRELQDQHITQAFIEAKDQGSAILAFTNHDFRDIREDVSNVVSDVKRVQRVFPDVKVRFANASDAARQHLMLGEEVPHLEVVLDENRLLVTTNQTQLHSHQPFLAIKHRHGAFLHDNFDQLDGVNTFCYTFDLQTIPLNLVETIGVAVVGKNGKTATALVNL